MSDQNSAVGLIYWARVDYKNPDRGPEKTPGDNLQVCFVPDDPAVIDKEAASDSQPIRWYEPDGEHIMDNYVRMKTNFVKYPLKVVDAKGNELPHDLLLGNGTRAKVYYTTFPYDYGKTNKGTRLNLSAIQVLDLKVYEKDEDDNIFDEEEGFTYEASA